MTVIQDNTLKPIELAGNNIPVILSTDNFITVPGLNTYQQIAVTALENGVGKKLQILWKTGDVTFTTATSPDNSGLEIPKADSYGTVDLWVADIVVYIKKNEQIFGEMEVWNTTNIIHLAALEPGENKIKSGSPSNPITVTDLTVVIGVDEVRNENFEILVSVYIFKEVIALPGPYFYDRYEKSKSYELEPLDNSKATFFLEGSLKPHFIEDVLPVFNLLAIVLEPNLLLKFYYRYAEKFGSPPAQTSTIQSDVMYALPGGINRKDFANISFFDDILDNGSSSKFLTWHPLVKELTKEQHDYLYYIHLSADTTVNFDYTATLIDGTTEIVKVIKAGVTKYDVFVIPVGYNYVNNLGFTKEVVGYNFVVHTSSDLTETRTFKINQLTPLLAKYYLFKNSHEVYESICFTGERTNGILIDKLTATRIINYGDDETVNENIISSSKFNKSSKVFTGFKTQADLEFFIEFLKSKSVYEQMEDYYKPVFVNTKKVSLYKDQEFISSAAVDIIDNTENNYSNAT